MTSIRRLGRADLPEYTTLLRQGLVQHPDCFRISPEDIAEPLSLGETEEHFTLGAFSEAEVLVGVVSFTRDTHTKMQHKGLLSRMHVAAEASGQGLGRQLIRECIARARTLSGLETVLLTVVASSTRARQLYISEDFMTFAREERALKTGEAYLDEEQMRLDLRG